MSTFDAQSYHTNQVHYLRKAVVFGDAGATISLGWVPDNAIIIDGGVVIDTVFNSATSDTLDIGFREAGDGTADDPNEFATLLDLTTAGRIVADELATAGDCTFPNGAEITATFTSTGTAATTGAAVAYVTYLADNS